MEHVSTSTHEVSRAAPVIPDEVLQRPRLVLELGCGGCKRDPEAVGVDLLPEPGVDIVGDAIEVLAALPADSVDEIHSEHFLEHIEDARAVIVQAARVLKPGGVFRATVPHFSNAHFYSDPTHRTFFGLYTFSYWLSETPFRRTVPMYYDDDLPLSLTSVTYTFKSARPHYVRHAVRKAMSSWVNLNTWTQEFYEENLTGLLSAYELEYVARKRDPRP